MMYQDFNGWLKYRIKFKYKILKNYIKVIMGKIMSLKYWQ